VGSERQGGRAARRRTGELATRQAGKLASRQAGKKARGPDDQWAAQFVCDSGPFRHQLPAEWPSCLSATGANLALWPPLGARATLGRTSRELAARRGARETILLASLIGFVLAPRQPPSLARSRKLHETVATHTKDKAPPRLKRRSSAHSSKAPCHAHSLENPHQAWWCWSSHWDGFPAVFCENPCKISPRGRLSGRVGGPLCLALARSGSFWLALAARQWSV